MHWFHSHINILDRFNSVNCDMVQGPHRASPPVVASTSIGIRCDAWVSLGNRSGTAFQASQRIPMDVEAATVAAAATDAHCGYTLSLRAKTFKLNCKHFGLSIQKTFFFQLGVPFHLYPKETLLNFPDIVMRHTVH